MSKTADYTHPAALSVATGETGRFFLGRTLDDRAKHSNGLVHVPSRHQPEFTALFWFSLSKLPIFYLPTGDTTKSPEDQEVEGREEDDEEKEENEHEEEDDG